MPGHNHSIRWTASCALSAVCAAGLAVWAGSRARAEGPAPAEPPPVAVAPCERPPLLDGALDDACWRTAAPTPFTEE